MERSMLNITYRDRKTNVWIRQKTNVTEQVTYGRGQGTSVEYEVTDGHRISPPGIPGNHTKGNDLEEKQWTDELDEYWQRTAQDRQLWKQHDDDFTQLLDTMEAQWRWWVYDDDELMASGLPIRDKFKNIKGIPCLSRYWLLLVNYYWLHLKQTYITKSNCSVGKDWLKEILYWWQVLLLG